MFWFRNLTVVVLALFGSVTQAGFDLSVQSFDTLGVARNTFVLGETVQIRLVATETGGSPVLGTDGLFGFTTRLTATTSDANDATSFTTPFPTLVNDGANFNSGSGRTLGGSVTGVIPLPSTSPQTLLTFNYTADVGGTTNFGFNNSNVGFNVGTFVVNGNLVDVNTNSGLTLTGGSVNVAAVPEPSSVAALVGVAMVGFGVSRYRRKRAK